jgi:hypothetical protein
MRIWLSMPSGPTWSKLSLHQARWSRTNGGTLGVKNMFIVTTDLVFFVASTEINYRHAISGKEASCIQVASR